MRRCLGVGLAMVLLLGVAGCYEWGGLEDRVAALEAAADSGRVIVNGRPVTLKDLRIWADSMTVDNIDGTDPGTDADPAYSYMQSRAICQLLGEVETMHASLKAERGYWLKALCGSGDPDPVYPPTFPPQE